MLEAEQVGDVRQEREQFLNKLQQRVNFAFDYRAQHSYSQEQESTAEIVEHSKKEASAYEGLSDDDVIDLGVFIEPFAYVAVKNPYDYRDLLVMSWKKILEHKGKPFEDNRAEVFKSVDETLKHEFEHHVPALGHNGLQLWYTVQFLEDPEQNVVGFHPAVGYSGKMPVGVWRAMTHVVQDPSASDLAKH